MDSRLLEQLAVPTPPYRARTPKAVLAMTEDAVPTPAEAPVEQPSQQELDEQRAAEHAAALQAERDKEWEQFMQEPEQTVEEATESITVAASVAKGKITSAPPIPEATPDISAKDDANKTEAIAKVERVAVAGRQNITTARDKFIKTGTEVASDALREIRQGRRQPYRAKPNLPAEREAFSGEQEKANSVLNRLEAAGRGATPEAQYERDRIDVLQAQLEEITPRKKAEPRRPEVGDIITEGKTSARILEVDATGRPTRLERIEDEQPIIDEGLQRAKELETAAPAPVQKEPTPQEVGKASRDVMDVIAAGGRVVDLPGGKTVAEIPSAEGGVRIKKLDSTPTQPEKPKVGDIITEGKTRAKVLEVNTEGRPTRLETIPAEPVNPEPPVSEAAPASEKTPSGPAAIRPQLRADIAEAQGKGMGPGHGAGRKKEQKKSAAQPQGDFDIEFPQPETREKSAGQRAQEALNAYRDAMEDKNTKPEMLAWAKGRYLQAQAEYEAWRKTHKEEKNSEAPVATPERQAPRPTPEVGSERVNIRPGTEQARPVEAAREDADKENLRRENAELRRMIEQIKSASAEKIPASPEEKESGRIPGKHEQQVEEALTGLVEKGAKSSVWERMRTGLYASLHDVSRVWWAALAKDAKDSLKKTDKKLKALDELEKEFVEKSGVHTLVAPIYFGFFKGKWHAQHQRDLFANRLERWTRNKERREDDRADLLNVTAGRTEILETVQQESALKYKAFAESLDEKIDKLYAENAEDRKAFLQTEDVQKRLLLQARIKDRLADIEKIIARRSAMMARSNNASAKWAEYRTNKDSVLGLIDEPTPDLSMEARPTRKIRKKPKRQSVLEAA